MNSRDLIHILGKLPEDVQIIEIDSVEKAIFVPKAIIEDCERIKAEDWVYFIYRKAKVVVSVWVVAITLFPSLIPTPERLIQVATEAAPTILAQIDWSFSQERSAAQNYSLLFRDTFLNGTPHLGSD